MTNGAVDPGYPPSDDAGTAVRRTISDYGRMLEDAAIAAQPEVAAEIRLRRGMLLFHRSDLVGAIADVQFAISSSTDPYIVYAAQLFQGLALDAKGESSEARAAYRAALRTIPNARSAALLLAQNLFATGLHTESASILQAAFDTPAVHDPWLELTAGDYRFWASDLQRLRGALQP
jgi:tetratricopeptide (TPR) repeat protein